MQSNINLDVHQLQETCIGITFYILTNKNSIKLTLLRLMRIEVISEKTGRHGSQSNQLIWCLSFLFRFHCYRRYCGCSGSHWRCCGGYLCFAEETALYYKTDGMVLVLFKSITTYFNNILDLLVYFQQWYYSNHDNDK